jgi:preprotein translocase subunit SecG
MTTVVLVIHLLIAMALIGVVLLQRSEGGALGIGGGGGGGSLFSSRGAANVLTRTTAILAVAFFITSITLTMLARNSHAPSPVFDNTAPVSGSGGSGSVLPQLPAAPAQPQVPSSN